MIHMKCRQMIHMKGEALLSLKKKKIKKNIENCLLMQLWLAPEGLTRKAPNGIMDIFILKNEESESCLSCMGNTHWSSFSSPPNMKAIHWRIKVTYNFEKRLTKRLTWDNAYHPIPAHLDIAILKDGLFSKNPSKNDVFSWTEHSHQGLIFLLVKNSCFYEL